MHKFSRLLCLGILCLGMVVPGVASATTVTGEIYFIGGDPINYLSPSVVLVGPGSEFSYRDSVAEFSIDIDPAIFSVAIDAVLTGPTVFFPWDLRLTLDEPWPALTLIQDSFVPGMTFYIDPGNTLRMGWDGAMMLDPSVTYSTFLAPRSSISRPVPEPGTFAVVLGGIVTCLFVRRKRRAV